VLAQLLLAGHFAGALQLVADGWPAGTPAALEALTQVVTSLADAAARTQLKGRLQRLDAGGCVLMIFWTTKQSLSLAECALLDAPCPACACVEELRWPSCMQPVHVSMNSRSAAKLVNACTPRAAGVDVTGASAAGGVSSSPLSLLSVDPQEQQLLLGASHMSSPAALLWSKLRLVLQRYAGVSGTSSSSGERRAGLAESVGGPVAVSDSGGGAGGGGGGIAGRREALRGWGDVLRVAAADAILRVDRRMALPVWLLHLFTVGCQCFVGDVAAAPLHGGSSVLSCW
jgi:hypothetical protein